ncbi:MAG TPA: DUF192 domain-containing protein [Kofleriaceae bacterium]|nr:DUF192 domain-containing protein [Kofleriaceae bacterium]
MHRAVVALLVISAACSKSPPRPSGDGDAGKKPDMPSPTQPPASDKRATIHLEGAKGDVVVAAEVVATPATIQRGLMYRSHLPPDEGMLFLMGYEDDHVFWMHNTLIPLDMIFIGKDMKVAGVYANATPRTDDHRSVGAPSLYVLEVNGGWAAAHGVAAGSAVKWDGVEAAAH